MSEQTPDLINLADFIEQVKADLAPREQDEKPVFYIDGIELEAQVVVSHAEGGKAGLKVSVLGLGAEAGLDSKRQNAYTQTLKLKLSPIFSKEQLLEGLSKEETEEYKQKGRERVMRGGN